MEQSRPFYKKWWVWLLAFILILPIILSVINTSSPTSTTTPDQRSVLNYEETADFKKMTAGQHIEAAKKFLPNSPATAKLHLNAIPMAAPEASQVEEIRQQISNAEKQLYLKKAEQKKAETIKMESAAKKLSKEYDKFENITWYQDPSSPRSNATNNIKVYIGRKDREVWLRYKISYTGENWLFIESYQLMVDGTSHTIIPTSVDRDNSSIVWEWMDAPVNSSQLELLKSIAYSKDAKIRYEGPKYRHDRTITAKEKSAIKNVLAAFEAMGGKP